MKTLIKLFFISLTALTIMPLMSMSDKSLEHESIAAEFQIRLRDTIENAQNQTAQVTEILEQMKNLNVALPEDILMLALQYEQFDIAKILLDAGANPAYVDKNGMTTLHIAGFAGNDEIVQLLAADPRVNVNAVNHMGETPLMVAVRFCRPETVQILIANGANPMLAGGAKQQTPLQIAQSKDQRSKKTLEKDMLFWLKDFQQKAYAKKLRATPVMDQSFPGIHQANQFGAAIIRIIVDYLAGASDSMQSELTVTLDALPVAAISVMPALMLLLQTILQTSNSR